MADTAKDDTAKAPEAAVLTRGTILAANDLKTQDVPVPQWGGTVRIRMLTAKERAEFENYLRQMQRERKSPSDLGVRLAIMSIVDPENGQLMFTDKDEDDLSRKSATAIQTIAQYALALNKMREKDVEDAVAAFTGSPSGDSSSV